MQEHSNYLTLQEAVEHPGVEAVIFAQCEGKPLEVTQIDDNLFTLESTPDRTFGSVEELEKAIQEQCPSYRSDARIWHDEWTGEEA